MPPAGAALAGAFALIAGPATAQTRKITNATQQRCGIIGGQLRCSNAVIQSNNAETDDRGYIYVADRVNTGLHILELTGEARAIAGPPPL